MKLRSLALACAVGLLIAGCGGGGGGASAPPANIPIDAGVATFSGARADYTIAGTATGYTVTDKRSGAASNVSGARALRFTNMTVNLAIGDRAKVLGRPRVRELIELHIAFHSRIPQADALDILFNRSYGGQTAIQIADALYAEAVQVSDVSGYSAAMAHSEYVTALYKNVFGMFGATAPTIAEVEFWANRIGKSGISRGAILLEMLDEARSGTSRLAAPSVRQLLENRILIGDYFAVQQGLNYNAAAEGVARTRDIAAAVTATDVEAARALIGFADSSFNLWGSTK